MIIIVTGTVLPGTDVRQLTIRDGNERLHQYLSALDKLIELKPSANIVFCENSGYGTKEFELLLPKAKDYGIELELLSFKGDSEAVVKHGKGYGEGEIMKYVLENSKLAQKDDYFIKITGRLSVDNIATITKSVKKDRIYFNVPNVHRRDIYDTRLYAMPIHLFKEYFADKYNKVDDDAGYILECVYRDVILENNLVTENFPRYPRIVGQSGSGGIIYEYKEWKSIIRDFLSVLNIYGKVKV